MNERYERREWWLGKRPSVAIEWFWAYLTYQRGTRLITGGCE